MSIQSPPKILILECRLIIAADLSLQFSKLGYKVIGMTTRFGNVLKIIEVNRPDIILMNIGFKEKTHRLRIAKVILEQYRIPIVFLSSNTDQTLFQELTNIRPYAFIAKPFEQKDLERGIQTTLKRMSLEDWGN